MRIVQQSALVSYSPFLALPAPKIAGLLPAHVGVDPPVGPPPKAFVYDDPGLAALPDKTRAAFDTLLTTLVTAAVGLLADELTEAEFALVNSAFLRQVTALYQNTIIGDPRPAVGASPFAAHRQQLDEKIDQMVAQSKVHLAETRERIARELAAMHTSGHRDAQRPVRRSVNHEH